MTQVVLENIKAIAFDLDGTLVDSASGLADAIDNMLNELNFPPAGKERVSIWVGNGVDILVERALSWAGAEITPELQKEREPVLINSMQHLSQQAANCSLK